MTTKTSHIQVPAEQSEDYSTLTAKLKDRQEDFHMPLFIRDLWVDALLSGEYIQGYGYMLTMVSKDGQDKQANCCLGVLGMEIGLTPFEGIVLPSGGTLLMHGDKAAANYCFLEDWVADMLGLTEDIQRALARANDDSRLPFPLIAKAIEETL